MNSEEIWKPIIMNDSKTKYSISNLGKIMNCETNHILSSHISDGHVKTTLILKRKDLYESTFTNAKLVLKAFRDEVHKPGYILYYKDGNIANPSLDNIEYITIAENFRRSLLKVFRQEYDYYVINDDNLHADEKWKIIMDNDRETKYMISNYGHVFNVLSGAYISPSFGTYGYPFITIRSDDGHSIKYSLHRIVAEYFVPNPNPTEYTIVHHKNHNKADFIYSNLEWVTSSLNAKYAIEVGAQASGEDSSNSVITEEQAKQICDMLEHGYRVSEIQRTIGCSRNVVRHIRDKKTWKHISKDYSFDNTYKYFKDEKTLDSVVYLRSKGLSYSEIGRVLNMSASTVTRITQFRSHFILNAKALVEAMILKLHARNYSIDSISKLTGLTKTRVKNVLEYYENDPLFND